jgi:predicted anti-sigma-YlaC factor YlaD
MAEPNNCHHLLGSLSDYLDGEMSDALCAEIEHHLANCNNCRVVVDTLRQTIQLYRALSDPDLPEAARERLYQSLDLTDFLPES